ncbi:PTS cellobiose transporter subunit IIC [Oceanobacillus sp. FSL W7-1281]|uniref:PTS cellobiose transporter subunit IIC n=1 Tax=Oceanobacillus TaxID=182709 RepID=UPI0030DA8F2F
MAESEGKVFAFLEKYLMGPMGKVASWRFVRAIMAAGMAAIPFVIVGSMFLVFNILPETFPFLQSFFDNTFFRFEALYMLANKTTIGLLALYFGFTIGYEYTKIFAEEEELNLSPLNGGLLSIFALFMTIPQLVWENGEMALVNIINEDTTIIGGWEIIDEGLARLDATGVFSAIIMAILAVQLYRLCVKKNWIIKMPEQVPEGVSRSFTALIPAFVTAFVVLILNGILVLMGTDIFKLIQIPFGFVTNLTGSWLGMMVITFILHTLWIVGIHGSTIIGGLLTPIWLNNMQANIGGANIPYAGEFQTAFILLGGAGATLGLCVFMAFLAKSKQLSVLGKTSLVPGLFNINEPILFGLPVIYNPFMAIPFFLAPMVAASIGYWALSIGIVNPIVALMPWPTPPGVGAFISTGDFMALVVALIGLVVASIIWYPFFKMYDKKLVAQEKGEDSLI